MLVLSVIKTTVIPNVLPTPHSSRVSQTCQVSRILHETRAFSVNSCCLHRNNLTHLCQIYSRNRHKIAADYY